MNDNLPLDKQDIDDLPECDDCPDYIPEEYEEIL